MFIDMQFKKRDKANWLDWNYSTTQECFFVFDMPHSAIGGTFKNAWMELCKTYDGKGNETVTLIIAKEYAWDGCSWAPDLAGTLEGSLPHDAMYQFVEAIAATWGWTIKEVLSVADDMFNAVMVYYKVDNTTRQVYYVAVCKFGYTFNRANAWRGKVFGKKTT